MPDLTKSHCSHREVFNGDLGIILTIDTVEQEVTVLYGERTVVYDYADLNEIALAWSISIHKSQGSEYPVIVLPIYMQHYMMLTRNLFYTLSDPCQEVSDRGWSKKSDISGGALY